MPTQSQRGRGRSTGGQIASNKGKTGANNMRHSSPKKSDDDELHCVECKLPLYDGDQDLESRM